jgi:hypothetical protein
MKTRSSTHEDERGCIETGTSIHSLLPVALMLFARRQALRRKAFATELHFIYD